jgi:hypothetical protein
MEETLICTVGDSLCRGTKFPDEEAFRSLEEQEEMDWVRFFYLMCDKMGDYY